MEILEKTVDDVLVERITVDTDTNEGTIEVFDGDTVETFTRSLVAGSIEVRNSDGELLQHPESLDWTFIYGVHNFVDEADMAEQLKREAALNAELEEWAAALEEQGLLFVSEEVE